MPYASLAKIFLESQITPSILKSNNLTQQANYESIIEFMIHIYFI